MAYQKESSVLLETRDAVTTCFNRLFNSAWAQKSEDYAGILSGEKIPLYGEKVAALETFSRLLWGYFPLLATGEIRDGNALFRLMAEGTDPDHPHYWGEPGDFDQRSVEMAVFGFGLAIASKGINQHLSAREMHNFTHWLAGIRTATLPQNNWSFFPLMIEAGLYHCGQAVASEVIEHHFALLDRCYLGDGWYSDGPGRPRDYYNAMALHFYGLIWSRLMADLYPARCAILRQRASLFARDFIHFFDDDGAAIAFGRSMTYRFAQAAFWSAAAFAELDSVPYGVSKGLILRHLQHWLKQDIIDPRGILTVGYGYANDLIAEDYNAPGSPYWACKIFIILALDEAHPFWQSEALPLPARENQRLLAHAGQIVIDDRLCGHHYLLNAGQTPGKPYANSDSKYAKFAYSSALGFNLERSRYGLELNACDSTLLLSEQDGYWRGPRDTQPERCDADGLAFRWQPWPDVQIKTWLIPLREGYCRLHIIDSARPLATAEGGFPVPVLARPADAFDRQSGTSTSAESGYFSRIVDLSPLLNRPGVQIISPPASNIIFPCSSAIPVLTQDLTPGQHILCCRVYAGKIPPDCIPPRNAVTLTRHAIHLNLDFRSLDIPL